MTPMGRRSATLVLWVIPAHGTVGHRGACGEAQGLISKWKKDPPTEGGAIYLQTGPSHDHMEAKEEVDGVLGALGDAQDPVYCRSPGLCHAHGPLVGGRKEDRGKTVGGMWCPCPWKGNLDPMEGRGREEEDRPRHPQTPQTPPAHPAHPRGEKISIQINSTF
jgi:hypothetical protein